MRIVSVSPASPVLKCVFAKSLFSCVIKSVRFAPIFTLEEVKEMVV